MNDQPKSLNVSGFKLPIKIETKPIIIIGVVVVLLVAVGGYWFWSKNKQGQEGSPTLGSEIFDKTQNQLEGQVPDTNPFKDQKNPFDVIYQNPFE